MKSPRWWPVVGLRFASFADWLGVSQSRGGLNLGPGPVSATLAALIIGSVGYLTVTGSAAPDTVTR